MENTINPIKFRSSGLCQPFYSEHEVHPNHDKNRRIVSYNADLLAEFWRDEKIAKRHDEKEIIDKLFWEDLTHRPYFKPLIFKEKEALECGLIPFYFAKKGLLAVPLSYKGKLLGGPNRLHAYQVLVDHTIDAACGFFENKSSFEDTLGKDIVDRMEKILYEGVN